MFEFAAALGVARANGLRLSLRTYSNESPSLFDVFDVASPNDDDDGKKRTRVRAPSLCSRPLMSGPCGQERPQ